MGRGGIYLAAAGLLLFTACGGGSKKAQAGATPVNEQGRYLFTAPSVPLQVPPEQRTAYMREHYWDKFDFADTLFIANADTTDMLRAYAVYAAGYLERGDSASMAALMRRASTSKRMFDYFVMMAEEVLHDPNSPLRNDELYIPVLEAQLASPFYDEYERMRPAYELNIARQNRIGRRANDFRYTLASGRSSTLYSIAAEYLLIFINNPGCPMCKQIQQAITGSQMLSQMQSAGRLKVLAIYPDSDLDAWFEYAPTMPAGWINAYDKGCVIEQQGLYNLRAIPAIYLLAADKTVLVKDSTNVEEVEYVIFMREQEGAE